MNFSNSVNSFGNNTSSDTYDNSLSSLIVVGGVAGGLVGFGICMALLARGYCDRVLNRFGFFRRIAEVENEDQEHAYHHQNGPTA